MKIEAGTQIDTTACAGCGANVPVKVNRAGCVYYFCAKPLARDDDGKVTEKCFTRFNFGRTASQKIINDYLKEQNNGNIAGHETEEEGKDAGQPREPDIIADSAKGGATDPVAGAGGFGNALKHFITGQE